MSSYFFMRHQELDKYGAFKISWDNEIITTYHYYQKPAALDEQRAKISYLPVQTYLYALK